MIKIKDIKAALDLFEEAATKHAEATEKGDFKTGNKCYDKIVKAITFLKNENAMDRLLQLLSNPSVGVRMWAASYILPIHEEVGIKVLEEIVKKPSVHSLTAETTINEWRKGNLKF